VFDDWTLFVEIIQEEGVPGAGSADDASLSLGESYSVALRVEQTMFYVRKTITYSGA
jgi:hypothetical protein